jgi:hypothetical protein
VAASSYLSLLVLYEKQLLSTIAAMSTKRTTTLPHFKQLNTKKTTACVVGKPSSGLGWAQKCDGVKPADGISTISL